MVNKPLPARASYSIRAEMNIIFTIFGDQAAVY